MASSDDPWITTDRAHSLAVDWGSHFTEVGPHGHLNAVSGLGEWREGQELLNRVLVASGDRFGHIRAMGDARAILATPPGRGAGGWAASDSLTS